MQKILLIVFTIFFASSLFGQSKIPHIIWAKSYGGTDVDQALSISQTIDNGFIISGESFSADGDISSHHGETDNADCWIVKTDSIGTLHWEHSYGGLGVEYAYSIKQTPDGGYIFAGYSGDVGGDVTSNHGGEDFWIVKIDSAGVIEWQKSYGGSKDEEAYSVDLTSDGGYIVTGFSLSIDGDVTGHHGATDMADVWVVKLEHSGKLVWQRSLGGTFVDIGHSAHETPDHGFIIAGEGSSNDGDETHGHLGGFWIVKLDSAGALIWQKSYGGVTPVNDICYDMQVTKDGGVIAVGSTYSNDGDVIGNHRPGTADFWIIKTDGNGNLIWKKDYGGDESDIAQSVVQTYDGGYIVGGYTASTDGDIPFNHGDNDYWIMKLDVNGNLEWQKTLGGTGGDYGSSIIQTRDSGFVIAGTSDSDDGDVKDHHFHEDYWVVKLGYDSPLGVHSQLNPDASSIYPNPFTEKTEIVFGSIIHSPSEIIIYNILGSEVRRIQVVEAAENAIIHRNGLLSGSYIYHRVTNGKIIEQGRLMVE